MFLRFYGSVARNPYIGDEKKQTQYDDAVRGQSPHRVLQFVAFSAAGPRFLADTPLVSGYDVGDSVSVTGYYGDEVPLCLFQPLDVQLTTLDVGLYREQKEQLTHLSRQVFPTQNVKLTPNGKTADWL